MAQVTFTGTNASITLHGVRFEPGKPALIEDDSIVKKLRDRSDFEIQEEEGGKKSSSKSSKATEKDDNNSSKEKADADADNPPTA
ncbi:hypothetical protein [Paenibacillus sp. SN-8-1]|uniref:hypothetical protein n=1 Tax=Paenibacillus sp. SN-8-1 TaxID=3435409 RepID=UPI003D9A465B